ncbi:MAG: TonB-dependent receptor plug domain-containing protein, partial [Bacteroidales bacterium]|nr:TonB-dependent receptor plug domain-containing protein [Bacteroidales bacterium]
MKNNIIDILQRQSLRLSLCALAMTCCTVSSYAQDDMDDPDETTAGFKAPKRRVVADKNTLVTVSGTVVDDVTKQPVAGVRVQALGDVRYTSMTNAKGEFTLKLPDFATSLFVQAPRYMSQQVAIKSKGADQKIMVSLLNEKFKAMYTDGTEYTATNSFTVRGGGLQLDDDIQSNLGGDIRAINRSGASDGGNAMFIRGLNSLNANAQPLIILDGVEIDMQQSRTTLHQGRSFNMLATLSPEDIQSVKVLKNATALYGARGGNGVIII